MTFCVKYRGYYVARGLMAVLFSRKKPVFLVTFASLMFAVDRNEYCNDDAIKKPSPKLGEGFFTKGVSSLG